MTTPFDVLLEFAFLRNALLAALMAGALTAALGVPVVLRNLSMLGHGIAHVAWTGVAIGFAAGVYPLGVALVLSVAGALAIHRLQARGMLQSDAALGMVSSVGFALGVTVVTATGGFNRDLDSFLFGTLFGVTTTDLWTIGALGAGLLLLFVLLYKELFYLTFSEEGARLSGVPVDALNVVFMALTAAGVVLASRIVGLLLVAALLVIPAATGLQLARSFRGALGLSVAFGLAAVLAGFAAAVAWDLAPGGTIVLAAAGGFVGVVGGKGIVGRMGSGRLRVG